MLPALAEDRADPGGPEPARATRLAYPGRAASGRRRTFPPRPGFRAANQGEEIALQWVTTATGASPVNSPDPAASAAGASARRSPRRSWAPKPITTASDTSSRRCNSPGIPAPVSGLLIAHSLAAQSQSLRISIHDTWPGGPPSIAPQGQRYAPTGVLISEHLREFCDRPGSARVFAARSPEGRAGHARSGGRSASHDPGRRIHQCVPHTRPRPRGPVHARRGLTCFALAPHRVGSRSVNE
jgi:hypothetical protein